MHEWIISNLDLVLLLACSYLVLVALFVVVFARYIVIHWNDED